jgi:hypothetical protein
MPCGDGSTKEWNATEALERLQEAWEWLFGFECASEAARTIDEVASAVSLTDPLPNLTGETWAHL